MYEALATWLLLGFAILGLAVLLLATFWFHQIIGGGLAAMCLSIFIAKVKVYLETDDAGTEWERKYVVIEGAAGDMT